MPRWGKNFLKWRIRPVAQKLGIPDRLVTFQVMRRTLGTDMQQHGTLKDTQGMLRHASIKTTGRCLRSDDRTERPRRCELAHVSGARRLDDAGEWFGPEGEKSERSECNSAKFGEVYF